MLKSETSHGTLKKPKKEHMTTSRIFLNLLLPDGWASIHRAWGFATPLGLGTLLMLAVRRSLRNSERLILPSLSMSASSSSGSIDPFKPVCWILKENLKWEYCQFFFCFYGAIINICIGFFSQENLFMFYLVKSKCWNCHCSKMVYKNNWVILSMDFSLIKTLRRFHW